MHEINRDNLEREREALIGNIRAAFAGVTREGGVSWSEARVIDNQGTDEARDEARQSDQDTCWQELLENQEWVDRYAIEGIGGFGFLDAVGFRYYLPAAMICDLQRTEPSGGSMPVYALKLHTGTGLNELFDGLKAMAPSMELPADMSGYLNEHKLELWSLLTAEQRNTIKRYLLLMEAEEINNGFLGGMESEYRIAYDSYWRDV